MTIYADLGDLPEDDRIRLIGQQASEGKEVAFVVETHKKADRYVRKLTTWYPRVQERIREDFHGMVAVRVGLKPIA